MSRRRDVEKSQELANEVVTKIIENKVNDDNYEIMSNAISLGNIQHELKDISITLAMICDKLGGKEE